MHEQQGRRLRSGARLDVALDALAVAGKRLERLGIPVYDAQVIGYPQRMVDFESGRKPDPEALDKTFEDLERRFSEPDKDTPNN